MQWVFPNPSLHRRLWFELSLGVPVKQRLALWMPEKPSGFFAESDAFNQFGGCDIVPLVFLGHVG